ncbi:MAG: fumarylacetoacetate hydrolase family protein [Natronospirillum sp.]
MSNANLPVNDLANELLTALRSQSMVQPLSERYPGITVPDAYAIQQKLTQLRVESGERVIGKKIGVTSRPVMDMLGVRQPDFGMLTNTMVLAQGESLSLSTMIQPKAEGEIAFVMKDRLQGPGTTNADVLRDVEGVMACFEIVDSRVEDWRIKIEDTVADNASCGMFILGDRMVSPSELDLFSIGMVLEKNNAIVGTGAGAASMGSPVAAVAWLANTLGKLGMALEAGDVVLSGALSAMVPVAAGDQFRMTLAGVGGCAFNAVE